MKKLYQYLCPAVCLLNITLPGGALATPLEELLDRIDGQTRRQAEEDDPATPFRLALMTRDGNLETVDLATDRQRMVGDTLFLFLSDAAGRIVKDAQLIATVIDRQGRQFASRALPVKCGYLVTVDHLPGGEYRAAAEIISRGQLLTAEFTFLKS